MIAMSMLDTALFASTEPVKVGVGFHNVGSGVLRASNEVVVKQVEQHYGERCGHLPLDADNLRVLVNQHTPDIRAHIDYLSQLFGKPIAPQTLDELCAETRSSTGTVPLVVPYINVPETEALFQEALAAQPWGLPGNMTHALKNKANFYQLAEEFDLPGFCPPDYTVVQLNDLPRAVTAFLARVDELYQQTAVAGVYPLGVMLRGAESDGNYGCCLLYETGQGIALVPNGDAAFTQYCTHWHEALTSAQAQLAATMNEQKEARIVVSRYIDFIDSPGLSVVIMDGHVEHLGWNGQLQKDGSKACVGTSTFQPKNSQVQRLQAQYEEQTAAFFETFLRKTAQKCGVDMQRVRGVANLDIMLPGELEQQVQRSRKHADNRHQNYLAECNPRWTNYTDAIMTVLGASGKAQTINTMKSVIREGISTYDKHPIPAQLDPRIVRAHLAEKDQQLKQGGTRIICRMAKKPMGLIFAGDLKHAQHEVHTVLAQLVEKGH